MSELPKPLGFGPDYDAQIRRSLGYDPAIQQPKPVSELRTEYEHVRFELRASWEGGMSYVAYRATTAECLGQFRSFGFEAEQKVSVYESTALSLLELRDIVSFMEALESFNTKENQ